MTAIAYKDVRDVIQDGDVVFITNKKGIFIPQIIRFFTRSSYHHVGIAFWIQTGDIRRLMMVEAQGAAKRRILNISYYENDEMDVIEAPQDWKNVDHKALEKINQVSYGYLEAIYVGLHDFLLKYFDVKIPNRNFSGEICSEFVARVYDLPRRNISPQMLMEQLTELGHKMRAQVRG